MIKKTELYMKVPFKLDGPFTELYFGRDRTRAISYTEFSQFLHDFHEECALEAFKLKDPNRSGYITALDFQDIMLTVKKHLLTAEVKDNLVQVCNVVPECQLKFHNFKIPCRLPKDTKLVFLISWRSVRFSTTWNSSREFI